MENNVKLINFKINNIEYKFNEGIKAGTKFNINPKIECKMGRKDATLFVNLSVRINEDISSPVPFNLSVSMFSTFAVVKEATEKEFITEAVEVLYPFLRASVTSITANCNIPPYVLPVINSSSLSAGETVKPTGENLN